jgi:hypothetical protein
VIKAYFLVTLLGGAPVQFGPYSLDECLSMLRSDRTSQANCQEREQPGAWQPYRSDPPWIEGLTDRSPWN